MTLDRCESMTHDERVHQSDELLTSTQAGLILGKSGRTVVRMAQKGMIKPATQLPGVNGAILFRRSDIEDLARERAAS
jgi:hypothetical protein